jgi:hypothetical protein
MCAVVILSAGLAQAVAPSAGGAEEMNCPTCGAANFSPPWLRARQAGFNPVTDCVLMANKFGRVQRCGALITLGRTDCSGGTCPVAAKHTAIVTDRYGRTKEVFRA